MKIIFRTLAILAAAFVIVGGLYAFSQSSVGQSFTSTGTHVEGSSPPSTATSSSTDGASSVAPSGSSHGSEGSSLMGLVSVGKTLGITAAVTALLALGERLLAWGRRKRSHVVPPTPV